MHYCYNHENWLDGKMHYWDDSWTSNYNKKDLLTIVQVFKVFNQMKLLRHSHLIKIKVLE